MDRIFRDLPGSLQAGRSAGVQPHPGGQGAAVWRESVPPGRWGSPGDGGPREGGKLEILIERVLLPHEASDGSGQEVVAHIRVSKKPLPGGLLHLAGGLRGGGFDAPSLGRWPDDNKASCSACACKARRVKRLTG
ncbi:MAG: hypothetical protein U5J83_00525 [Bryobacterales bacterium]|nr:hypothetical protein [Bryobacterales bacterium]